MLKNQVEFINQPKKCPNCIQKSQNVKPSLSLWDKFYYLVDYQLLLAQLILWDKLALRERTIIALNMIPPPIFHPV